MCTLSFVAVPRKDGGMRVSTYGEQIARKQRENVERQQFGVI